MRTTLLCMLWLLSFWCCCGCPPAACLSVLKLTAGAKTDTAMVLPHILPLYCRYINEYPTGRLLRDAKLYELGAGTSGGLHGSAPRGAVEHTSTAAMGGAERLQAAAPHCRV